MKNTFIRNVRNTIGIFGLVLTILLGTASAQGESRGSGRLTGTWDAVVTLKNCVTGDAIRSFNSIASFTKDGTTIGSTAGIPQSLRTPEHGIWRHEGGNTYAFKFKSFSFDAAGNPTGWSIVTHQLELDHDNNSYNSAGIAQIFAPNGVQVAGGCSSAIGTRFEF